MKVFRIACEHYDKWDGDPDDNPHTDMEMKYGKNKRADAAKFLDEMLKIDTSFCDCGGIAVESGDDPRKDETDGS
tara:strand:- start:2590 stop:2814 length:225 start_codon:yes stop_codon:yes gene_type:complete